MTTLREACARGLSFFRKQKLDLELDEELAAHIELATEEHIRQGMGLPEARRLARIKLGGIDPMKELHRDSRGLPWLDGIIQDIQHSVRGLRHSPGFALTAIATLAIGIGVNTAVFTVTNAVLLKGFRLIDRNDRILYIHSQQNGQYSGVSYSDFQDWRTEAKSFEGLGTVADLRITLNDEGGFPQRYAATRITTNAFRLLGQQPILGRDFVESDATPGAPPVAILNYSFWERRYGKDSTIIGRALHINRTPPTTIIGVMPDGFSFPQNQDLWLPLTPTSDLQPRDARKLWFAFGRMTDGVTKESARAELETIGSRLARAYPRTNQGQVPQLESFSEFFIGSNATLTYAALWGAVGFVLLIACSNLANLMLARAIGRSREISLRIALGAGRWRIIRQALIESLVLTSVGGACGWLIAKWGVRAYELAANPPASEWNHDLLNYTTDYRVLAYFMAIAIGAALFFGLAPSLRFSRLDLNAVLKDGGHGATRGGRGRRLSSLLVVGEMALATVLLAGAGVMIRSFLKIATADVGVPLANTLEMLLHFPEIKYARREAKTSFLDRLKTRLEAIPGVESASIGLPPAGGLPARIPYELAGAGHVDQQSRPRTTVVTIGPDYFRTLSAKVLTGRDFNAFDGDSGPPAVIVNERFASQQWPVQSALGQRLRLFNRDTPQDWLTVVGVVSNIVYDRARQEITPVVYLSYAQAPTPEDMWVLMRTPIPAGGLASSFRQEIGAVDPDVVIWLGPYDLGTRLSIGGPYGSIRNHALMLLIFAAIALALASVGLYTISAYSVSQRTQEIGVRLALGATASDILDLVFKQGMLYVGVGLGIGLAASLAINRLLKAELVQVSPSDPITLAAVSAALIVAAVLGCLIPARRAMRVDPLVALRHD
jgi:putative ABC transport system permease protein